MRIPFFGTDPRQPKREKPAETIARLREEKADIESALAARNLELLTTRAVKIKLGKMADEFLAERDAARIERDTAQDERDSYEADALKYRANQARLRAANERRHIEALEKRAAAPDHTLADELRLAMAAKSPNGAQEVRASHA